MTAYDITPYPDLAYGQTHPDRLAVQALLFGVAPPSVATCRVLEIGCAAGGNLLPMAARLPRASFVGIDASREQIAAGRHKATRLGLANVTLLQRDVRSLGEELGRFDYIVAHGVYSWVTETARDALLALCQACLRPHGVAYISYNTYPGWHGASVIRDWMRYAVRKNPEPHERAHAARAAVKQMEAWIPPALDEYAALFRRYGRTLTHGLKGGEDGFLLHDELEEINDPVYFHEFATHAAKVGLRFLGEAAMRDALFHGVAQDVLAQVSAIADDRLELEQMLDFVQNRMFRQSLLCLESCPQGKRLEPRRVMEMWVRCPAARATAEARPPQGWVQFRGDDGTTLTTGHALTAAAVDRLCMCRPNAMPFDQLLAEAQAAVGEALPGDAATLAADLLRGYGYSSRLIDLHTWPAALACEPGDRPLGWSVARLETETRNIVTNGWHERVRLTTDQCYLLHMLDGLHTRSELRRQLESVGVTLSLAGLEQELVWLAQAGLLMA